MTITTDLKEWAKKSPAIIKLHGALTGAEGAGAWLYHQRVLEPFYDSSIREQLPAPLRAFVDYCHAQQSVLRGQVVGGEAVFALASRLSGLLGVPDSVGIRLPTGDCLHVNLRDPSMLGAIAGAIEGTVETRALASLLAPGDTFLDIGANHGMFCLAAAPLVGPTGRILAFEPQPVMAELVKRTLADSIEVPFEVFQVACGEEATEADFYRPLGSSGKSGLHAEFSGSFDHETFRVQVRPLDELVSPDAVEGSLLMKLDVEGHELFSLRGGRELMRQCRPRILLEVNPFSMKPIGVSIGELIDELHAQGYTRYRRVESPTGREHAIASLSGETFQNIIAVPD